MTLQFQMRLKMLLTKDSLHHLLDIPEEHTSLVSLRHSKRAKRLLFKFSVRNGVEIVLPRLFEESWVVDSLTKRKTLILKRIDKIKKSRLELLPSQIQIPLISRSWNVVYADSSSNHSAELKELSDKLVVNSDKSDVFSVPAILQKWIHTLASDILPDRLLQISKKMNIGYNRVSVKNQKTRWGSCSEKGNINLNRNLLFFSEDVVDYVIHHELIHRKVLNHSAKFWSELEAHFPTARECSFILRQEQNNAVPIWATV